MSKKGSSGYSGSTVVNFACLIAIVIAIVIWVLQIVYKYTDWTFIGNINGVLSIVKDVLLAVVVFLCGIRYALSMKDSTTRIILLILCIMFAVLFIVGIVLL